MKLFESMAINLYLAKRYKGGLQPKAFEDEARAIQCSIWAMTEIEPPLMQVLLSRLAEDQRDGAAQAEARAALKEALRLQPDLSGELIERTLSFADPELLERFTAPLREAGWEG